MILVTRFCEIVCWGSVAIRVAWDCVLGSEHCVASRNVNRLRAGKEEEEEKKEDKEK